MIGEASGLFSLLRALTIWMGLFWAVSVDPSLAESTAAFRFSEPGKGVTAAGTDGFQFAPVIDIVVTSLGYYDRGGNGLADLHPVSLFHAATGRELALAHVTEKSMGRSNFRFEPIQPVRLKAGETYVVAGFTAGNMDPPADTPADLLIAPQIGYQGYVFVFSDRLELPTNTDLFSERTFFGPNFEFHAAPQHLTSTVERPASCVARRASSVVHSYNRPLSSGSGLRPNGIWVGPQAAGVHGAKNEQSTLIL